MHLAPLSPKFNFYNYLSGKPQVDRDRDVNRDDSSNGHCYVNKHNWDYSRICTKCRL